MAADDIYTLLLGGEPDARATAREMADQLRRRRGMAQLSAIGAPDPIAALGGVMQKQASEDEKNLYTGLEKRMQYGQEAQAWKEKQAAAKQAHDDQLKAQERALRLTIEAMRGSRPRGGVKTVKGTGNKLYQQDAAGNLTPMLDPETGEHMTSSPTRPLPTSEKTFMQDLNQELRAGKAITGSFKDEYAGHGALGKTMLGVESTLGSWGTQKMQDEAQWWGNFKMLRELPARNKMFGSALTAQEISEWNKAQNIGPHTSPKVVKDTFNWMLGLARKKLQERAGAALAEQYPKESIKALASEAFDEEESASPAAPAKKRIKVDAEGNVLP